MFKHMKRCIFTKVKFMALFLFAVLMTACTADVYEPKPDPDPKPGPDESTNGIPNDFDYSTKASHKLTVKVLDEYEGKRYYTIEVFGSDPITDPNSVFYVGVKQTQGIHLLLIWLYLRLKNIFILRKRMHKGIVLL